MSTLTGTNYFVDLGAALRYYAPYGFSRAEVFAKRARGEIHTGVPSVKPGESLELNAVEGRYFIRSGGASTPPPVKKPAGALDFEIVAQAMKNCKPAPGSDDPYIYQWENTCEALADAFEKQTPAFERARFLEDCGYAKT